MLLSSAGLEYRILTTCTKELGFASRLVKSWPSLALPCSRPACKVALLSAFSAAVSDVFWLPFSYVSSLAATFIRRRSSFLRLSDRAS